jgi:hypothetical protein
MLMTKHLPRLALVAAMSALVSGCALGLGNPKISELKSNPGRYYDRTVNIDGVVTESWGMSPLPFRMYKVDDGTGEVTVLANNSSRMPPSRGSRVHVKGKVNEVAVVGGQSVGLHLREEKLDIRRGN